MKTSAVIALLFSPALLFAQVDHAAVDRYIESELQSQRIPGLALGVYRDGKIEYARGYGLANVELNVPVNPQTIFQSGSVGKQFAATAIMMLVEEGKISLDDPITKYFPDAPDTWKPIKVKNLLSHTSGLAEYETEEMTKPGGPINMRADYTEDELIKIIEKFPMDFQPGERWAYRNTNYVLLGVMIHKVSGKFYGDFLQERIFRPLGMSSTRVISDTDIVPNRSAGYELHDGQLKNQEWVSPTFNSTADGTLYFNVLDLVRWDQALYGERLLKRSSFDTMWTVMRLNNGRQNPGNYGFAWSISQVNGHRMLEHGGAWQGFTMYLGRYVDDKVTVVVLTNLDAGHSDPGRIGHHVAEMYVPGLAVAAAKPLANQEPQVTQLLRGVILRSAAGAPDKNDFEPAYADTLTPGAIKRSQERLQKFGELKSLEVVGESQDADLREFDYRASFANTTLLYRVYLNRDNKIARISLYQ